MLSVKELQPADSDEIYSQAEISLLLANAKEVFKRAIMQPGPPEHFALLTVLEFIKPQQRTVPHTVEEDDQGAPHRLHQGRTLPRSIIGTDFSDNLNDLLRFLWRDDPQTHDEFKQVRKWNKASKDLIPIIEHYQEDQNLLLNAGSTDIRQQLEYLWRLKSVVTSSDICAVVVSFLKKTTLEWVMPTVH
ncbi:hypothetical protein Ahy_A03g015792 [Arachis hypogaea]|uniref:Timeless N-terminal domain-containing protein n=1 Tax=Arachis hypogaea TaxID=3818 RepID=A0A445E1A9_ARAHY|nr:hypothetical protein Ahy_A03g015792 [Arachis hypogaea]